MKQSLCFYRLLIITLLVGAVSVPAADSQAARANETQQKGTISQRLFASPDDAAKALQTAVEAKDKVALAEIFGPQVKELLTGDTVQDANNAKRFAALMAQGYTLVKEGDDKVTVEVGTKNWPMPTPLVKSNEQWYFNTAEGKEEIIARHIGKDELHAIGVCRAYVAAQQQYASLNPDASHGVKYAQKFKSSPGKMDGLYWAAENEKPSPFGPLVAEANAEGYVGNKGTGPHPFHGYYFRILTRQGKAAPGGSMNYMNHSDLTMGFALVAYPAQWDRSGVMTFIVNQKAQVFQQNLGEKTSRIAGAMKEYNPDRNWALVSDTGVVSSVTEK
jgi:Protein of unknown function (DUF2950)